jgi:hypothetical protein
MTKPYRDGKTGRFVVGRESGEKFSAVEGVTRNERTGRLLAESDRLKETPGQLRERVRNEFSRKR